MKISTESLKNYYISKYETSHGCDLPNEFRIVSEWAKMMEEEIKNGSAIEEIFADTKRLVAGDLGIAETERMMGFLYEVWEHGKELQKWYEGGYHYNMRDNTIEFKRYL